MARGTKTPLFVGLSALFYLVLLFSPLALLQGVHAQNEQEPLQEDYGTGQYISFTTASSGFIVEHPANRLSPSHWY